MNYMIQVLNDYQSFQLQVGSSTNMMLPNANWANNSVNIDISIISPKQMIGECLDLAIRMMKQLIDAYNTNNNIESVFVNQKTDFTMLANYIIDPIRLEKMLAYFINENEKASRQLAKSWLFQLKHIRNSWAHSSAQNLDYRLANRAFDTLSLIFIGFGGDKNSELFAKIEFYRKNLLIATAKKYHLDKM